MAHKGWHPFPLIDPGHLVFSLSTSNFILLYTTWNSFITPPRERKRKPRMESLIMGKKERDLARIECYHGQGHRFGKCRENWYLHSCNWLCEWNQCMRFNICPGSPGTRVLRKNFIFSNRKSSAICCSLQCLLIYQKWHLNRKRTQNEWEENKEIINWIFVMKLEAYEQLSQEETSGCSFPHVLNRWFWEDNMSCVMVRKEAMPLGEAGWNGSCRWCRVWRRDWCGQTCHSFFLPSLSF